MPPSHFLNIHLYIILPSTLGSVKSTLSFRFPHQNPVRTYVLPHICYTSRPSHSSRFIPLLIFGEKYRSLSSSLRSFLHCPVTSSLLGPNIFLSTLFSNAFSLRSDLNVSDHVSYSHQTTGKIIVLYTFIFMLLDINLEDTRFCTEL